MWAEPDAEVQVHRRILRRRNTHSRTTSVVRAARHIHTHTQDTTSIPVTSSVSPSFRATRVGGRRDGAEQEQLRVGGRHHQQQ